MIVKKQDYIVMMFHTTSEAIGMEKFCGAEKIPGRIIPVPREISASCGLCWRMLPEEYEEYREQLLNSGREYDRIEKVRM